MPEELWIEACNTVQEAVTKTIPKKKKCKKVKWLSHEVLQIAKERREKSHSGHRTGKQGRKRKLYSTECKVSENSKER